MACLSTYRLINTRETGNRVDGRIKEYGSTKGRREQRVEEY